VILCNTHSNIEPCSIRTKPTDKGTSGNIHNPNVVIGLAGAGDDYEDMILAPQLRAELESRVKGLERLLQKKL